MREKIEKALEKVRPMLEADGGSVELIEVSEDGIVKVRLTGSCGSCPFSSMTLKNSIERIIKVDVPEVKQVIAI
jgi:Fe-S cluster biogenesis protein NfuA